MSNGQSVTRAAGRTGRKSSITTAVALASAASPKAKLGVEIYADEANSDPVYYGFANTITTDAADSTDGFPILPGKSVLVRVSDPSLIYVVCDSSAKVWWVSL